MPDFVTDDDLSALAGEYVLGTLDPTERNRANVLLEVDQRFRGLVRVWERRFGELHLMVEPVTPDAMVWQRIGGKLGIGQPAPPPPPAPAVARAVPPAAPAPAAPAPAPVAPAPEVLKREETKSVQVEAADIRPAKAVPDHDEPAEIDPDAIEVDEVKPERELAALIEEVERYTETMKGKAPPPEPATPKLEPATVESAVTPKPELVTDEAATVPKPEPATAEAATPPKLEPASAEATPVKPEPEEEEQEAAREMQRVRRDAAARDAAAAALVAVEQAREHLRRRPQEPAPWRAVALLMSFLALGLSGLIAAWRFVPDQLPARLRPMAVLNIPESPPSERPPAEHGTQFEE